MADVFEDVCNIDERCWRGVLSIEVNGELYNLGDAGGELNKYISTGVAFIKNISKMYEVATTDIKKKLLSSILDEKLVFTGKKYRTPKYKAGFNFIYQKISRLEKEIIKKGDNLANVSSMVAPRGIEPLFPG